MRRYSDIITSIGKKEKNKTGVIVWIYTDVLKLI